MNSNRIRKNSRELQSAARGMRREPTPAEKVLWDVLRGRGLDGLRFRRQHPVGRFVLDFYCPIHKLAVAVDGEVHDTQQERDAERTAVYRSPRLPRDPLPQRGSPGESPRRPFSPQDGALPGVTPSPAVGRGDRGVRAPA